MISLDRLFSHAGADPQANLRSHAKKSGVNAVGVGYHGLQLLRFAAKHAKFGRVATIGRQELGLDNKEVCSLIGVGTEYKHEKYCDSLLLRHFAATCVDSWDYSGHEGASHIADMNKPLNERLSTYDTVIDFGSLEHVYNAPQALL